MLLFYIRHGDPIYSPDSLTPLGIQQADALSKRLAMYGIDEIYASSSERAQMTARPTAKLLQKEIHTLDWCNEKYVGEDFFIPHQGWVYNIPSFVRAFNSEEIRRRGKKWAEAPEFEDYNFVKGLERVRRETDAFLASLGYRHIDEVSAYYPENPNEKRIALFAHEGFSMVFLSTVLDIPYPQFSTHFDLGHSNFTVIQFVDYGDGFALPRVLTHSNDSHMYREGIPTNYQNRLLF